MKPIPSSSPSPISLSITIFSFTKLNQIKPPQIEPNSDSTVLGGFGSGLMVLGTNEKHGGWGWFLANGGSE